MPTSLNINLQLLQGILHVPGSGVITECPEKCAFVARQPGIHRVIQSVAAGVHHAGMKILINDIITNANHLNVHN